MSCTKIILVAEADLATRNMLEIALTPSGHQVVSVNDGRDALGFLRENTPDMVIVGATLPLLDGFEICDRMKRIRRLRCVPVMVLCENQENLVEHRLRAHLVKADALEVKPISSKPLHTKVIAFLTSAAAAEPML